MWENGTRETIQITIEKCTNQSKICCLQISCYSIFLYRSKAMSDMFIYVVRVFLSNRFLRLKKTLFCTFLDMEQLFIWVWIWLVVGFVGTRNFGATFKFRLGQFHSHITNIRMKSYFYKNSYHSQGKCSIMLIKRRNNFIKKIPNNYISNKIINNLELQLFVSQVIQIQIILYLFDPKILRDQICDDQLLKYNFKSTNLITKGQLQNLQFCKLDYKVSEVISFSQPFWRYRGFLHSQFFCIVAKLGKFLAQKNFIDFIEIYLEPLPDKFCRHFFFCV
eukprot:TRINITY_DN931_c0_g2_i5.p3 TRINITY_DN931_c0_g2~~TRINITY_DN931_c0_g2_i5.p3  ORF type:complete len:277 (-),score=-18.00 TRINITY_DN931_c0_g2_i5:1058-1888(-)